MINNTGISQSTIFADFPKYNYNTSGNSSFKTSLSSNDSLEVNQDKKKSKKRILFGSTLASTILTAGILAMVLGKGLHGSSLSEFFKFKPNDISGKAMVGSKKAAYKAGEKLQSVSNFTAIKDFITDKILRKTETGTKFTEKTTAKFRKIVDSTLGKKYDKTGIDIKNMSSAVEYFKKTKFAALSEEEPAKEITIKGVTKPLSAWFEELSLHSKNLESAYDEGFGYAARKIRNNKRLKMLSGIKDKIRERFFGKDNGWKNIRNYSKYVTEDVTSEARTELAEEIIAARKKVTNNPAAVKRTINTSIDSLTQLINVNDENTIKIQRLLKKQARKYAEHSGVGEEEMRKSIVKEAKELINTATKNISQDSRYNEETAKILTEKLRSIEKIFEADNARGALEEITDILKGLNENGQMKAVSNEELKEFLTSAKNISKGLKNSTELESGSYFLKQAEMEVGSAPTDVFAVMVPVGTGIAAVASGNDKDEKISATLTTCIPLVGTFAAFVYGTTKMCFGVKNIAISLASGIALSKLGNYADKLYKNYQNKGSVVEVAKDEYDKLWTGMNFDTVPSLPLKPKEK